MKRKPGDESPGDGIRGRLSALHGEALGTNAPAGLDDLEYELREYFKLRHAENGRVASAHAKTAFSFARVVIGSDEEAVKGVKLLEKVRAARKDPKLRLPPQSAVSPQIKGGSVFAVLTPGYSASWNAGNGNTEATDANSLTFGAGSGSSQAGTFGTSARSIGGGVAWGGGGVGSFFSPLPGTTWVRFAPLVRYSYAWMNDSYGFSAHNDAHLGLLVESWDLAFHDYKREQNQVRSLWSIGTAGWEPTRSGREEGLSSSDSVSFPASSDRYYRLWAYAVSSCDGTADSVVVFFKAGSQATNQIICEVPFMVVEQS